MGEYFYPKGYGREPVGCKIGTCDDWRYSRFEELLYLQDFADLSKSTDIRYCLDKGMTYRFPFPHEDYEMTSVERVVEKIGHRNMFDRHQFYATLDMSRFDHKDICVGVHPVGEKHAWNVNVFVPCVQDPANKMRHTRSPNPPFVIHIFGERRHPEAGHLYTVFACGYCGGLFSLSGEESSIIENSSLEPEIMKRIKFK